MHHAAAGCGETGRCGKYPLGEGGGGVGGAGRTLGNRSDLPVFLRRLHFANRPRFHCLRFSSISFFTSSLTVPFERIDTAGYRRDLFRLSLGIELQQLVIVFEQYGLAGRFYRRAQVYKRFFYHRLVFFDKCMIEIRSFLWHNRTLNRPLNRMH